MGSATSVACWHMSDDAPLLADQSLDGMLRAVDAEPEARHLNLSVVRRREGWESVVLETADWIVRFPRREDIAFATELSVLAHVHGRLPVETPDVAWIGSGVRCMTYPKIVGAAFVPQAWEAADEAARRALAESLADLLSAWQAAFSAADVDRLGIKPMGGAPYLGQLQSGRSELPSSLQPLIGQLLTLYEELYEEELAESGPVVLHGDFHLGNMVLADQCGPVTGLWDFSCVATGAPSWDLHYLAGEISSPADDQAPGTGRHLDLLGRVLTRLRGEGWSNNSLLLADIMQCTEWIGDHEPDEATQWHSWLTRLAGR